MRVLLAAPWYFPDSMGGTEVYVRSLVRQLHSRSIDVAVAVPGRGAVLEMSSYEDVRVFRFPSPESSGGALATARPEPEGWCSVLDAFAPQVVDLHALTSGLELAHLRAARQRGMRTVVTLHVPNVVCARGTFMRFGRIPCPGNIEQQPCTACRLAGQGIPSALGRLLSLVPLRVAAGIDRGRGPAIIRRAATARLKDYVRFGWLREVFDHADRLVSPSQWLVDVLLRNGAPPAKVVLCRQGVDPEHAAGPVAARTQGSLRVGFIGRYDPVKGLHVLIDAVKQLDPGTNLEIHVWGVARSSAEKSYRQEVANRAGGDRRIVFHEETPNPTDAYRQIDVLAVPSVWLETGPLVVLEAQAAGLPVVGSNLGGIAERVTDGQNGILVRAGDSASLARALASLARDPRLLESLRPTRAPRTVTEVASETLSMYASITGSAA